MSYLDKLNELAQLMFPNIQDTIADLEKRYPFRNLNETSHVTRFAPSPTGFLHTGSLFTALIAQKIAHQSQGVFYVRLEDTDTKREIAGSDELLIKQLAEFDVIADEGFGAVNEGKYGPYRQSERALIYQTVIKQMVKYDLAYPCFATIEELDELRKRQEARKLVTGYYGSFAIYRDYPLDKAIEDVKNGLPFVVRFKSSGQHNKYIQVNDLVRGNLSLSENDQDIVILKSDGLPTYHFAHIVDDHFMHTTTVTRGEEWLASLPIHIQIFASLGWTAPQYAHLPVIMKLDDGKRRKLSKRLDSEAAVSYFIEQGYPKEALIEYLMTIANSDFEEWRIVNKWASLDEFILTFDRMSLDGALFDLLKVIHFSKEALAKLDAETLTIRALEYAKNYHPLLEKLITRNMTFFQKIVNIERLKENPRKDYTTFASIYELVAYFYRDHYQGLIMKELFGHILPIPQMLNFLKDLINEMDISLEETEWFSQFKDIAQTYGFASSNKIFKQNPDQFIGHIGQAAELLRVALTAHKQTPNLYQIMHVLGTDEVRYRLQFVIELFNH